MRSPGMEAFGPMFGVKLFLVFLISLVLAGLSSRGEPVENLETRVPSRAAAGAAANLP